MTASDKSFTSSGFERLYDEHVPLSEWNRHISRATEVVLSVGLLVLSVGATEVEL